MANKFFSLALLAASVLFFFGCDKVTAPKPVSDPTGEVDYTIVWADEFEQSSAVPNPANWGYDLGYGSDGWGNDEWQLYTNNQQNVKVENGNLVISALFDSQNYNVPGKRDGSITSARVNTKNKFSFKFGKAEARIKAPTGTGMWPAFWALGNSIDTVGWPKCGEIDIMELSPHLYDANTSLFALHWWNDTTESHASQGNTKRLSQPLSNDYHVYTVEWDQTRVVGKIDNIVYFTKVLDPATMSEFLQEYFLVLNVAVGGNLGGAPDASTVWPQNMYVDWVRVYQASQSLIPIHTYGLFTDETPVDAGLQIGVDSEIYVWENTLSAGNMPPYEGSNVISWNTTGVGWFGGGISSNAALDLSGFANGNIKFRIKIPANVSFKIGINDTQSHESYVLFPANQTAFGLERNGEWGQAVIPVQDIKGNVDLQNLSYEFIILEQSGAQCQFALDDIYWDGGGFAPATVSFDATSYSIQDSGADINLIDKAAMNTSPSVQVSNGRATIDVSIPLNYLGSGSATINFGATNDDTNTISVSAGTILTVTYQDTEGILRTDTASITGPPQNAMGIYSETHTNPMLPYSQIINSADWGGNSAEPNPTSTAVPPLDGTYVLGVNFTNLSSTYEGIAFNFGSQDISSWSKFVIHVNKSAMPTLTQLGIKFEDNSGGNTEVNLSAYTPTVIGNWLRYEIPLSQFPAVNFSQVKFLGLWNPRNSSGNLLFGNLYFDDIYLTN